MSDPARPRPRVQLSQAELDALADKMLNPRPPLDPMPVAELLYDMARRTRELQLDLWTLRDSADAELTGTEHAQAVEAVAQLSRLYCAAGDHVAALYQDHRHRHEPPRSL